MSRLADKVLPLIRTRADLSRWHAANDHGAQMHDAVTLLREAAGTEDPKVVLDVTERAIASALRVIMRADDSSGIIGDACRDLLDLHPGVAAAAAVPPRRLDDRLPVRQPVRLLQHRPRRVRPRPGRGGDGGLSPTAG